MRLRRPFEGRCSTGRDPCFANQLGVTVQLVLQQHRQFGGGGVKVTPAGGSKTKKKKRIKPYDQWSPKAKTAFHAAAIVGSIGLVLPAEPPVRKRHTRRARAAAQRGRAPAAPPVDFGNLSSVR